jgi:nucleolar protein 4
MAAQQEAKKSVDNTVFVRFLPPSDAIRRHHVEDLFSDCGPIKKSSVIHAGKDQVTSSYGFVKYTVPEDAALAAIKLNNRTLKVAEGVTVTVKVELAKTDHTAPKSKRKATENHREEEVDESQKKKTNRLILRNLSFYAKENDIRKALAPFGELLEVHIPKVSSAKGTTHRGFCFVTFAAEKSVKKCLSQKDPLVIKERAVNIARSLHKTAYQSQQPKESDRKPNDEAATSPQENNKAEDAEESSGSDEDSNSDDDSESGSEDGDMDDEEDNESNIDDDDSTSKQKKRTQTDDKKAVAERRCLFLRNLPFDCSRHDIFEALRQFGFITSIYIVKDKETNKIPKGTAFVSFQRPDQATKALEFAAAATSSNFVSQRNATVEDQWENQGSAAGGIVVKGRRLMVDLAVDKETATTLTVTEKKQGEAGGKDRRNLYLKGEGRVENDEKAGVLAWDELPENDKLKRQTAWSEKNTKLRSPLFFINPNRLSLRNLAKHVDEAALKKLCVEAAVNGLTNGRVSAEDQIAHWRAAGELSTREILARIQEAAGEGESARSVIPPFDEKNIKQSIPSLHIHRDIAPGANKKLAPSRGFGFVEFEHHVHALACLRELNNNSRYSAAYATGGKQAAEMKRRRAGKTKRDKALPAEEAEESLVDEDGKIRIPRLIVEFTVENKAKAKQQAEHRAQQQANLVKQRDEQIAEGEKGFGKKTEKKKSRGAAQRERKRKQLDEGPGESAPGKTAETSIAAPASEPVKKVKGVKPPKKQKVDAEEENFSKLVESYKQQAIAIMGTNDSKAKTGRRWFE